MDRRLRDLERAYASNPDDGEVAKRLRDLRKRLAVFAAGDHLRLDASLVEDTPTHLAGNWRVIAAHNEATGRSYTLVRIGAVMGTDDQGRAVYEDEDIVFGACGSLLQHIRIGGSAPLTRNGVAVPPCPVPLHYSILARKIPGPSLPGLAVRERSRRTSAPDFALALTSRNATNGIAVTPRAVHLPPPEPVAVEDEVPVEPERNRPQPVDLPYDAYARCSRCAAIFNGPNTPHILDAGNGECERCANAPLAIDVQADARRRSRRSRRSRRRQCDMLAGAGSPEEECGCECHRRTDETDPEARCRCTEGLGGCTPGRRA